MRAGRHLEKSARSKFCNIRIFTGHEPSSRPAGSPSSTAGSSLMAKQGSSRSPRAFTRVMPDDAAMESIIAVHDRLVFDLDKKMLLERLVAGDARAIGLMVTSMSEKARIAGLEVEPRVLHDGCIGDAAGYQTILASEPHVVVDSGYGDYGYGHHSYNEIVVLADGRVLHAECGGCSCEGSGSWSFEDSVELARRLIPEQERAS